MSSQYLVKYSQRFDEIVYEVYGHLDLFEKLLELNAHLLNKMHLEAGDTVLLIEIEPNTKEAPKEENLKSIW